MPLHAQIPAGYYDGAAGLDGEALKGALHSIVKNHTRYPYSASGTDTWDILQAADEDPNNTNNVILLYTGRSQAKSYNASTLPYTGDRWNREHVWAKSHGFPAESDTAYTDCHHLRPTDESVNTSRSNRDFDNGGTPHSEATDCYYDSDSWEPRDAVKGDIARAIFYMVVRYDPGLHSDLSPYDLELVDYTPTDGPLFGKRSTLYAWHLADPVDDAERARNEVIYSYQNNRNPFIDHPEYASYIWGDLLPEPNNHVTQFSAHSITLNWTDAVGGILPDAYLVRMSNISFEAIATPVDGTAIADDANNRNVAYGVQKSVFGNLIPNTTYYFKLFAYKGSGATIEYKTDGVPQTSQVAR